MSKQDRRRISKTAYARLVSFGILAGVLVGATTPTLAQGATYRIGIIGSGQVGGTLGALWARAGDDVMFSSRHPEELKDLVAKIGHGARIGTPAEAAAFGDVILVAVPYKNFADVAKANGAALKGKVVFDASNAVEERDGAMAQQVHKVGIGQTSASLLPGTHLVRGFNAIAMEDVAHPPANAPIGIPLASDDPEAIKVGNTLVQQAGFTPIVVPLARADEFGPGRPLGIGPYPVARWKAMLGIAK